MTWTEQQKTGSRATPIYPGQLHTLLSRARSCNTGRIFVETNIVVSDLVKAEIKRD